MLLALLFDTPMMFLVIVLGIVYALTIHEFAHAAAATYLGDNTAKFAGRLSLNPLVHLDIFGTFMLLVAGFGWGRPVPVNPYNLKYRKWGDALVALAGPVSNFLSVIGFIIIFHLASYWLPADNMMLIFLLYLVMINFILGIFNLIPIPPLDGSKVLFAALPDSLDDWKQKLAINGPWILLILLVLDNVFNLHIFSSVFNFFLRFLEIFL